MDQPTKRTLWHHHHLRTAINCLLIVITLTVLIRVREDLSVFHALSDMSPQSSAGIEMFDQTMGMSTPSFEGMPVLVFASTDVLSGTAKEQFSDLAKKSGFALLQVTAEPGEIQRRAVWPIADFVSYGVARTLAYERAAGRVPVFDSSNNWRLIGSVPGQRSPSVLAKSVVQLLSMR